MPVSKLRTTLYLSVELHERLRRHALDLGTGMSQLVERYAWEGIARDLRDADAAASSEGPEATSLAAGPSEPTD